MSEYKKSELKIIFTGVCLFVTLIFTISGAYLLNSLQPTLKNVHSQPFIIDLETSTQALLGSENDSSIKGSIQDLSRYGLISYKSADEIRDFTHCKNLEGISYEKSSIELKLSIDADICRDVSDLIETPTRSVLYSKDSQSITIIQ